MKKSSFSTATATITIMLIVISYGEGLKPTAHAEPNSTEWQITITGLVEHSLNLSLAEITAMNQTTVNAAIICVDFPNNVIVQGNWTGVNLWLLLNSSGVSPNAIKVAFYASDGFSTDLPVETAKREDIILAYQKDGTPLGETLRLVVPGKWGYKWISQVTKIELVDYDFKGFWESRGYSDTADVAQSSPSQPQPSYPDPPGTVPEFTSVMAIFAPLILVTLFALMLKKRAKSLQQR